MEYINGTEFSYQNTCVAFGSFDGIHRGHQAVLDKLAAYPELSATVVSLADESRPLVTTEEEKRWLLRRQGQIARLISYPATAVGQQADFIQRVLVGQLGAKVVVSGASSPWLPALEQAAQAGCFALEVVEPVCVDGHPLSTDDVVAAIQQDDFAQALALLGHAHVIIGKVEHGKEQGRKFGMPTANVGQHKNKYFLPYGVYAVMSWVGQEEELTQGLCNIGLRPSDDGSPLPTIEENIFDFSRMIYGQPMVMEISRYIRPTLKFPSLKEVREQIDKDIQQIHDFLDDKLAEEKAKLGK